MKYQSKQINKIQSGWVKVLNLAIANGLNSIDVTTSLTAVLSTAGEGNVSVALSASTNTAQTGVTVTSPHNRVEICDNTTKNKLTDVTQNEVYGRITFATNIYTLSFYSLINGVETPFAFISSSAIDFDFVYRFQFQHLPADAVVSIVTKNISQEPKGSSLIEVNEKLNVTATNVVSNLTSAPSISTRTKLFVNGKFETPLGASPSFSVSGKVLTWNVTNAGYNLETTDVVLITYYI